MTRTITALFDSIEAAEKTAYDLATRVGGVRGEVYGSTRTSELSSLDMPSDDAAVVEENIRRGGAVLHAEVPDGKFEAVADAVEAAGAVDIDEREAAWRREGWTGRTSATTTSTAASGPAVSGTASPRGVGEGSEEVIPVTEERLRVGKREVGHGRVRIRSYVVETPVHEQVTLHEEHVQVERRPVDRPVGASDDVFRDRTIEATETSEEAVVSKEARVTEEVVVRKTAEEKTQTVSDTVRQTKVEVEDERDRSSSTAPGTKPSPSNDRI
jgi:uncharacterized protein (TIGR02271 family)